MYREVIYMLLREDYLSKIRGFYDSDLIKILVGIRRCGKSVILNQIIEELKDKRKIDEKHIIFINFEFIEFEELLSFSFTKESTIFLHLSLSKLLHNIFLYFTYLVKSSNISCIKDPKSGAENSYIFLSLALSPY